MPWLMVAVLVAGVVQGQSLYGEDVKCNAGEGERVEVPGITDTDPCISCYCSRGTKTCQDERKLCPSVRGCYNLKPKVEGECCRECADCRLNSTTVLEHGKLGPVGSLNVCEESQCWDGVLTRSQARCDVPCDNPTPPLPGQCCPSCGSCRWQGATLQEGETRRDATNSCRQCSCKAGRLSCTRPSCPVLPCPTRLQVTLRGDCCPSCSRLHSANQLAPASGKCFFREKLYSSGQSFAPNPCTTCSCSASLTVTCNLAPACKAAGARPSCTHRGTVYAHGDSWRVDSCTSCSCKLGKVDCSPAKCPACPPGSQQVPSPGWCCGNIQFIVKLEVNIC